MTETTAPASYVQRAMWARSQRNRGTALNVMILAWRIEGALKVPLLEAAVMDLINRHPALRTRLGQIGGQLLQIIGVDYPLSLNPVDVEGATAKERLERGISILREEGCRPLDLTLRPPVQLHLLRLNETDHILCFFVHHAMCDGWSSQIIVRDLAAFYTARTQDSAAQLPELKDKYADFADRQIRTYEAGGFSDEVTYWRNELADLPPPIEFPHMVPRKGNREFRAESPVHMESPNVLAGLKDFARGKRASLFSVLLSALSVLLYQRTGCKDFVVGVSTVNRWSKEAMAVVGCFTNLLPARIRLVDKMRFDDLVSQVHATVKRLLVYGRIPLELILRELYGPLGGGPVFPVWCQFREQLLPEVLESDQLVFTPLEVDRAAILCDLEADLLETALGLQCVFAHRSALFEPPTVNSLLADYGAILRTITRESYPIVSDLCHSIATPLTSE